MRLQKEHVKQFINMKKLLMIIVLGLLFSGNASAETYKKFTKKAKKQGYKYSVSVYSPSNRYYQFSASKVSYDQAFKDALNTCKQKSWNDCKPYQRGKTIVYIYPSAEDVQITKAQNTCTRLGYSKGTNEFRDCTLKVMTSNTSKPPSTITVKPCGRECGYNCIRC